MRSSSAAALLAVMLAAGCDLPGPYPSGRTGVTLDVVNDNWLDMDLYVVHGTTRSRIGQVSSLSRMEIEIGEQLLGDGEIVVMADPVGSIETYTTPAIVVVGHTEIDLLLNNVLSHSSYRVSYEGGLDTGALSPRRP